MRFRPASYRSLRMYNSLVERCFKDCVESFRRKDLDAAEEKVRLVEEEHQLMMSPHLSLSLSLSLSPPPLLSLVLILFCPSFILSSVPYYFSLFPFCPILLSHCLSLSFVVLSNIGLAVKFVCRTHKIGSICVPIIRFCACVDVWGFFNKAFE